MILQSMILQSWKFKGLVTRIAATLKSQIIWNSLRLQSQLRKSLRLRKHPLKPTLWTRDPPILCVFLIVFQKRHIGLEIPRIRWDYKALIPNRYDFSDTKQLFVIATLRLDCYFFGNWELRNSYHHHPESRKRKSSEANSGSIHPCGRYENAVKTRKAISAIAILWPVKAIFEKRAATVEVDTFISPGEKLATPKLWLPIARCVIAIAWATTKWQNCFRKCKVLVFL